MFVYVLFMTDYLLLPPHTVLQSISIILPHFLSPSQQVFGRVFLGIVLPIIELGKASACRLLALSS